MRALRVFLRPGWVALALVVVGFAIACLYVLAPWQLGKNSRTEHQNNLIKSAVTKSAAPIDEVYPGAGPMPTDSEWREVVVAGQYLPSAQAVVRLRSVDGSPAFEVLTPFRANDGRVFVVNRGYVRPQQGAALPPVTSAPDGSSRIQARIRAPEGTSPGRGPRREDGALQVYTIDPTAVGTSTGLVTMPVYLQLSSGQPGSLAELPIPQLDSGPYLSYGLQWIAFGVMAPLGLAYFVISEIRQRRAQKTVVGERGSTDETASTNTDAPGIGSVRAQRRRTRDQRRSLVSASSSGLGDTRVRTGIGAGPERSGTDAGDPLTDRYGR